MCPEFGSPCVPRCGDGLVVGGERCDTKLPLSDGYCVDCREVVPGRCGDGQIDEGFEDCDDSNAVAHDGCGETCAVEGGYRCSGEPSSCVASGLASDLVLDELGEGERATLCSWWIGAKGGSGTEARCFVEGVPYYAIWVVTQEECERFLEPSALDDCGTSSCTVADVERHGGADLCGGWVGPASCGGRELHRIVSACRALPDGNDAFCFPVCGRWN